MKSGVGGQPSLITLSQQPQPQQPQQVVLQANNAVLTSQQGPGGVQQTPGQPRQVAIQLQEQPPNLMTQAKVMTNQVVVSPHSAVTNSATNPRLRQQRKQSLK